MRNSVIIVAGGSGSRMGSALPKQFIEINGKAIIIHTLEKFLAFEATIEIVIVINESYHSFWEKARTTAGFDYPVTLTPGGETRFHSVKNGLKFIKGSNLIGVHDAVRPLVSVDCLRRVYEAAKSSGSAIPCIPLKESIREINEKSSRPLDRSRIQIVQTPQVFTAEILNTAYLTDFSELFTDDASVVEKVGYPITIIAGDEYNLKITTPEDLEIAKILLIHQKHLLQ